jgi:hypothetical protein
MADKAALAALPIPKKHIFFTSSIYIFSKKFLSFMKKKSQ